MPDLRQLRVFLAVAQELNFTRAASALFMTQQAVSKAIGQLERELGVPLFERSTHEVTLTTAGAELQRGAPAALSMVDAVLERVQRVASGTAGTVEVGVSPALGQSERVAIVDALRLNAPSLSVVMHESRPEHVLAALRDRRVELAFARSIIVAPGIDGVPLRSTRARLYVPARHRLAQRTDGVHLRELDGERLLVWNEPGTPLTDGLLRLVAAHGATVAPVLSRATGLGVSLSDLLERDMAAIAPPDATHDTEIAQLEFAEPVFLPVVVMWASGARPATLDRVLEHLGDLPGPADQAHSAG